MDSDRYAVAPNLIPLTLMPQRIGAQDSSDDWTGVTSTKQRKRLQNRLNQRAYRRRKLAQLENAAPQYISSQLNATFTVDSSGQASQSNPNIEFLRYMLWSCPNREEKTLGFARRAFQDFSTGCPSPVALPNLIRLNVLNAITHNAKLLGFNLKGFCADEFISPFNQTGPFPLDSIPQSSYPTSLRPTLTQVSMVHHPWSDLIPIPGFRDNLLRAIELGFDDDIICADLLRVDEDYHGDASLIVWGEPWDPRGWEASVAFLRKWGWLLHGCIGILESTNYWRQKRGEKRIKI